jgi:DNA polymerase-3 subunit delta'
MARTQNTPGTGFPAIDLGHERARAFLESCLRRRVPALLFTGPEGVGKELTAVDFARRLCCSEEPKCEMGGELCESCRQALALEHPGIHLIYPTPTQGTGEKEKDDEGDIGKILDEKRQDFFSTHAFTKKVSIRIARARAVIRRANSKPFGSPFNVFIFVDTHLMREEAQNALLKLVEEPPEHCVLVLITPNPDTILNTIRSRCQRVSFGPLANNVIAKILTSLYGVSDETADVAASLSRGNIRRALALATEHDDEARNFVYDVLSKIQDSSRTWAIEQALAVSRGTNRDGAARFLDDLASAYRDVMTADKKMFINRDRTPVLEAQIPKWNREHLPRVLDRIISTRNGILRRNLNIDAALVDLFLDIKQLG